MSKISQFAKGQECQARIFPHCNGRSETVVLAHRPGGGVATKTPCYQGAFLCSDCHDIIDGRGSNWTRFSKDQRYRFFADAVWRSQEIMRKAGLLPKN